MGTERCARNATSDTQPGILLWCPVGDQCLAVALELEPRTNESRFGHFAHPQLGPNPADFRSIHRSSVCAGAGADGLILVTVRDCWCVSKHADKLDHARGRNTAPRLFNDEEAPGTQQPTPAPVD